MSGRSFVYNLRLPGQYYDQETGLDYNWYRHYDPATGRYVQSDLLGLIGGINTYAYAEEDPLLGADPQGLMTLWPIIQQLFPMPWPKERCEDIKKKIENLNKDIEKRYNDMRIYGSSRLPQWGPTSSSANAESVNGHIRIINMLDTVRRNLEKDYDLHCRNNCPPGSPAIDTSAVPVPSSNSSTTTVGGAVGVVLLIGGLILVL